jgi:peptidoglycan hydrolase-like protein with peptidoglycan-binding domain
LQLLPKKPSYVTGTFGAKTKAALIKYQKSVGVTASAKTDTLTRTILNADLINLTLTSTSSRQAFQVPLLKACPEEKIENIIPGSSRYHFTATVATTTGYYIYKGERREVKEFDAKWVKANCTFPINIVY